MTNFNFLKYKNFFLLLSFFLVLTSITLVFTKGLDLGVDFKGGTTIEIRLEKKIEIEKIRNSLSKLKINNYSVKEFGAANDFLISTDNSVSPNDIRNFMEKDLSEKIAIRKVETVGPKVGSELIKSAIYSVLLCFVAMFFYLWFRFEWQFSFGGIVALFHDTIITVGVFSLLGLQFDLTIIAALLTIIGYSINDTVIKSLLNKEYRYKCKQEPIRSFCESKLCVKRKFGVGENVPTPEIERIEKYPSHPTIYIVYLDGKPVEVDRGTLHEFDKFSMEVMDQLNQVLMPIGKMIWKKLLHKIMSNKDTFKILEVPQAARLDYQLKELLGDFLNRATGKVMEDVKRGIPYTENGHSYFKYQSFNSFLKRSKSWDLPKAKTQKMLEDIFKAKEEVLKLDKKSMRIWKVETINVDKPIITETTMKEPAFK